MGISLETYIIYTMSWNQLGSDIDGEATADESGFSVSFNEIGDRVAIGANRNDGINGNDSGHVRVYDYDGTDWIQVGQDMDGEAGNDGGGRSVSLSANGGRLAIGANRNDGGGSNSGHVRVYYYNGTTWVQVGQDIDGEAPGDRKSVV